jgi:hypothetical protein
MALSKHLLALLLAGSAYATRDHKRGICFVHNKKEPQDDKIWVQNGSDITWYYNYEDQPTDLYKNIPQDQFEFVPMMWGVGSDSRDTTFLENVKGLISDGINITHVLGFNEPDAGNDVGGSNLEPKIAAEAWVANFEPLGKMGVKLGLPACTGGWDGMPWLRQFLGNCTEIKSRGGPKRNCTWDFLPVHWYDNFEGLASHIGERLAEYVVYHTTLQSLLTNHAGGPTLPFGLRNMPTPIKIPSLQTNSSSKLLSGLTSQSSLVDTLTLARFDLIYPASAPTPLFSPIVALLRL